MNSLPLSRTPSTNSGRVELLTIFEKKYQLSPCVRGSWRG